MPQNDAWYATVAYYRAWLFADGGFYDGLRENDGRFDPLLIGKMARYYGVARTIPSVIIHEGDSTPQQEKTANYEVIARHLNDLNKSWKGSLIDRAELVIETATKIRDEIRPEEPEEVRRSNEGRSKRMGPPYSAVSKFIWFAQPQYWTLYDNLASRAFLSSGIKGENRVRAFYRNLQEGGFEQICDDLREPCEASGLYLKPERIIDLVLMMRGGTSPGYFFARDIRENCHNFLAYFPEGAKRQLCEAADAVAAKHHQVERLIKR